MTRWNPSSPTVLGPEFLAGSRLTITPTPTVAVVQRFRSNSAETIGNIRLRAAESWVENLGFFITEITNQGSELDDGAYTTVTYAPNLIGASQGTITGVVGNVDEWPPVYTDTLGIGGGTTPAYVDLEFATAAFAPTGRIVSVALEVALANGTGGNPTLAEGYRYSSAYIVSGGIPYGDISKTVPNNNTGGTAGRAMFNWGEVNPVTGLPWTQGAITGMDTGALRVRYQRNVGLTPQQLVGAFRLIVTYETTERRLATGTFTADDNLAEGWSIDSALLSPTGAANWSKANATNYSLVIREAYRGDIADYLVPPATITIPYLRGADGNQPPADLRAFTLPYEAATVLTDGAYTVQGYFPSAAATALADAVFPFVLRTTAPATSADSQPYVAIRGVQVYTGSGSTQGEVLGVAGNFAGLRLAVAHNGTIPSQPLTVALKRRSDNVTMATFTVPTSVLTGLTAGTYTVALAQTGAAFALAAVQYYLDFTSTTPSGSPWLVSALAVEAGGGGVLYQEGTYNGGTEQADPINGTAGTGLTWTPADFSAVVDAEVTGPGAFAADEQSAGVPDVGLNCPIAGIPFVALTWTATALGAPFNRYEIERLQPDGSWVAIASITTESITAFQDHEARLGVLESYRIRVVRDDGASSFWSSTQTATLPSAQRALFLTSNEDPSLGVAYPDVGATSRDYQFPEAGETVLRKMYGRDFQVAFRPLAIRGVTFQRRLAIAAGLCPGLSAVGPPAAEALLDLSRATLSYVCVRDGDGNRWLGTITVPGMEVFMSKEVHVADLTFTETTDVPSTPDVFP